MSIHRGHQESAFFLKHLYIYFVILSLSCASGTAGPAGSSSRLAPPPFRNAINVNVIVQEYHKENDCPENLKVCIPSRRSIESINRDVSNHLTELNHFYTNRVNIKPGLYGKIVIEMKIDAGGTVLDSVILSSSIKDTQLEKYVLGRSKIWKFSKLNKASDIKTAIIPFVFFTDQGYRAVRKLDIKQTKTGNRSIENIMAGIKQGEKQLKAVYKTYSKQFSALYGYMDLRIFIHEQGHISDLKIFRSTLENPAIEKEILSCISKWTFNNRKNHSGITEFSYQIYFPKLSINPVIFVLPKIQILFPY